MNLAIALIFIPFSHAQNACPPRQFTPADQVKLDSDSVVIVTHASAFWDGSQYAKAGMDKTVAFAKKNKIPVVYMEEDALSSQYYYGDCNPDYTVVSKMGEVPFKVSAHHVYTVGGHADYGNCQHWSIATLLAQWGKRKENVTLTYVLDGLYVSPNAVNDDAIYADTVYEKKSQLARKLPQEVLNGNPSPYLKMTLLEMVNVIGEVDDEYRWNGKMKVSFLKGLIPWETMPEYQIDIFYNGNKFKPHQIGKGAHPPVLKIEFIDSIDMLKEVSK